MNPTTVEQDARDKLSYDPWALDCLSGIDATDEKDAAILCLVRAWSAVEKLANREILTPNEAASLHNMHGEIRKWGSILAERAKKDAELEFGQEINPRFNGADSVTIMEAKMDGSYWEGVDDADLPSDHPDSNHYVGADIEGRIGE